jgi:hypothetical protein
VAAARAEQDIDAFLKTQAARTPPPSSGNVHFSIRKKRPEELAPEKEDWFGVSSELSAEVQAKAGPVGLAAARHRVPGSPLGISFASELRRLVGERFAGRASWVYRAAHVSRQAYSAIISDENHRVARGTALALAFALHLSEAEAEQLLRKAGFSLSDSLLADVIYRCCLRHGVVSLDTLNRLLAKYRCVPLP